MIHRVMLVLLHRLPREKRIRLVTVLSTSNEGKYFLTADVRYSTDQTSRRIDDELSSENERRTITPRRIGDELPPEKNVRMRLNQKGDRGDQKGDRGDRNIAMMTTLKKQMLTLMLGMAIAGPAAPILKNVMGIGATSAHSKRRSKRGRGR